MGTNIINDYIAGAVGGAAGLVVGHPFDTTKVQLQIKQMKTPYSSTWAAMKSINKQGWVRGFYRGMGFPLASYGLVNSVFFGVYGSTIKWCKGENHQRGVHYNEVFLAGCIGGFAQLFVACPVDLVKVVLQSQIATKAGGGTVYYTGPMQCASTIFRTCGLRGFYRGLIIMGSRDIPASASYFLIYEWAFMTLMKCGLRQRDGVFASLLAGGTAGVLSWGIVLPLDVIKSHFQADNRGSKYRTIWHCGSELYKRNGLRVFGSGFYACALRAFPVNAVTFAVYRQVMSWLGAPHASH